MLEDNYHPGRNVHPSLVPSYFPPARSAGHFAARWKRLDTEGKLIFYTAAFLALSANCGTLWAYYAFG